jgi:aminodeoxyfutalosine synthase
MDRIEKLISSIEKGERLSGDEYLYLYETADFHSLAALADNIRTKLHGRQAFYIRNCHINYTNVCVGDCAVCTFRRPPVGAGLKPAQKPRDLLAGSEPAKQAIDSSPRLQSWVKGQAQKKSRRDERSSDSYTLTIDEITNIAKTAAARDVVEFHVVGGLNPDLQYDYYIDLVKAIRSVAPKAAIKAFTAVEIDHIAKAAKKSVEEILTDLKAAGLGCLPGGGAEIFSASHRQKHFPHKISGERWLEIHRIAHSLEIPTTATMLYNNSETAAERIEHLLKLRDAQDVSMRDYGIGFLCFVPLSCRRQGTGDRGQEADVGAATAVLDVRTVAMSRIVLDNIPHIKAFWPILGWDVAQVSLLSGADDLDGAIEDYKIIESPDLLNKTHKKIVDSILQLGLEAVERDSFYNQCNL